MKYTKEELITYRMGKAKEAFKDASILASNER